MTYLPRNVFVGVLLSVGLAGCSLVPERSYQDIMDAHEDYYVPDRDFHFASGDEGQRYYSAEDYTGRVPASEKLAPELRRQQALRQEVADLERRQPEIFMEQYSRYQENFQSESEKVYFLRLPSLEDRERFLVDKGIKRPSQRYIAQETQTGQNYSWEYKSKNSVWEEFGRPDHTESIGRSPAGEEGAERWYYQTASGARIFTFEEDRVVEVSEDRRYLP